MKQVLLVDDSEQFLKSLKAGLDAKKKSFKVLTASNGIGAIEFIRSNKVDLVVTDLKMPEMDGFELLIYLKSNFPSIPVIAMSAFATPEIEERLDSAGVLGLLEKPVKFDIMVSAIMKGLEIGSEEGSLTGISLPSFLQLLEMEQKTCLLEVHGIGKNKGFFYFNKGTLFDAVYDGFIGDTAAIKMIALDNVKISFKKLPSETIKKRTKMRLASLILDAMRIKDESTVNSEELKLDLADEPISTVETRKEDVEDPNNIDNEQDKSLMAKESTTTHKIVTTKEINQMALEKYLEELKSIKGYQAVAIMNFTGEVLASDTIDKNADLNMVGATFNDIFRSAHEACEKIGFQACRETIIQTPSGTIVMCCSGVDAMVHFHVIGILTGDGNQALMKMQIEKIIPKIMAELA